METVDAQLLGLAPDRADSRPDLPPMSDIRSRAGRVVSHNPHLVELRLVKRYEKIGNRCALELAHALDTCEDDKVLECAAALVREMDHHGLDLDTVLPTLARSVKNAMLWTLREQTLQELCRAAASLGAMAEDMVEALVRIGHGTWTYRNEAEPRKVSPATMNSARVALGRVHHASPAVIRVLTSDLSYSTHRSAAYKAAILLGPLGRPVAEVLHRVWRAEPICANWPVRDALFALHENLPT